MSDKNSVPLGAAKDCRSMGFTALYAVLVASLALAIGLAVANIALKESLLSSTARESQFAFYAADSGRECARFWDKQGAWDNPGGVTVSCAGGVVTVNHDGDCDPNCTFRLNFTPGLSCVDVTVQKLLSGDTTITTNGYNTCNVNDPRRVNRRLILSY